MIKIASSVNSHNLRGAYRKVIVTLSVEASLCYDLRTSLQLRLFLFLCVCELTKRTFLEILTITTMDNEDNVSETDFLRKVTNMGDFFLTLISSFRKFFLLSARGKKLGKREREGIR